MNEQPLCEAINCAKVRSWTSDDWGNLTWHLIGCGVEGKARERWNSVGLVKESWALPPRVHNESQIFVDQKPNKYFLSQNFHHFYPSDKNPIAYLEISDQHKSKARERWNSVGLVKESWALEDFKKLNTIQRASCTGDVRPSANDIVPQTVQMTTQVMANQRKTRRKSRNQ